MEIVLVILTAIYCLIILLVFVLFTIHREINISSNQPFVSIVIAARNEALRIKPTLVSLASLRYPIEKFEIIFVDDASGDGTADIIDTYLTNNSNWTLIRFSEKDKILQGKKSALKAAIERAQGEIILTTDADCIVPENWISSMISCFDEHTDMVVGHALLIRRNGVLDKLLRFDNLFSAIMVAFPALLGFPMSSVGRNMGYRKKAYFKSGGYDALARHKSGDDVHLTELFRKKSKGKIRFNFNKHSFTLSKTPDTLRTIMHQQIRKNSKILKKSLPSILFAVLLFFFHILLILFPFIYPEQLETWILLLVSKFGLEFITLTISAKRFSDTSIIPFIPFMLIFYPIYVSLLGIIGVFQKYEWKE